MRRTRRPLWQTLPLILSGLIVLLLGYLFIGWPRKADHQEYGVTWSKTFADYLGIDAAQGLVAVLDDLGIRHFRIPAYWTLIESKESQFQFDWLREQLDLIAKRQGKAIVVIGAKQPRWPECWIPEWAKQQTPDKRREVHTRYLQKTVEQFKHHPAVEAWQVHNEPGLSYGECDGQIKEIAKQDIAFVKRLDNTHPIYTTESGELSTWFRYAGQVDGIGVSVYRVVLTPYNGIFRYWFLPPWFYARHASLIPAMKKIYVSEFQMEPWIHDEPITRLSFEDQTRVFNLAQMKKNFWYAERIHLSPVYFWGAEWWYWMKTQKNHPEFWDMARQFLLK